MAIRAVSLLPSATDMICAMQLQQLLVGRTHECDAEGIDAITTVTESKCSTSQGMTSGEVHAAASTSGSILWEASFRPSSRCTSLIEWALAPYRVNALLLRELRPNVIITQVQTGNGATCEDELTAAAREWLGGKVTVVHLEPQSLGDAWVDMQRIAEALGEREGGVRTLCSLRARMEVARGVSMGRQRRRVLFIQWMDPIFVAGGWVSELAELAGGIPVGIEPGQLGAQLASWNAAAACRPEMVVFVICGSGLDQSAAEVSQAAAAGKGLALLAATAVVTAVVDAARLFSRAGPTLVESLEVLTEVLHPEGQPFGHKGRLWDSVTLSSGSS